MSILAKYVPRALAQVAREYATDQWVIDRSIPAPGAYRSKLAMLAKYTSQISSSNILLARDRVYLLLDQPLDD